MCIFTEITCERSIGGTKSLPNLIFIYQLDQCDKYSWNWYITNNWYIYCIHAFQIAGTLSKSPVVVGFVLNITDLMTYLRSALLRSMHMITGNEN